MLPAQGGRIGRLLAGRLCRGCSSFVRRHAPAQTAQRAATAGAAGASGTSTATTAVASSGYGNGARVLTDTERSQLVSLVLRSFKEDPSSAARILAKSLTEDSKRELQEALQATNDSDGLQLSRQLMLTPEAAAAEASEASSTTQQPLAAGPAAEQAPPTWHQLVRVAVTKGLPFIAFGCADNVIMITAGDEIDAAFGAKLGLSSMAAAGLGNTIADVVGINISHSIEQHFRTIKWMSTPLTKAQWAMKQTKRAKWLGSAVGMAVGCLLGMVPLLFISERKKDGHGHKHEPQQQESSPAPAL